MRLGGVIAGPQPNMVDEIVYAEADVDKLIKFKYVLVN